jgi:hypothetical protein
MAILSSNAFYMSVSNIRTYTLCDCRWDTNAIDQLPYYMKLCFLALHNSINEMAFDVLKEQGFHVVRYLRKVVCMDWTSKFILIYLLQFFFFFINMIIIPQIHCSTTINVSVGRFM